MNPKHEILFRGKDIYGGWIYGDFVLLRGISSIVDVNMAWANPNRVGQESMQLNSNIVDGDTVGQYVRFKDADGNRIFEGDVVEMFHDGINRDGSPIISYYLIDNIATVGDVVFQWGDIGKIVGNIYDNPDIMELVENSGKYEESMSRVVEKLEKAYPGTSFKFVQSREDGDVVFYDNRELLYDSDGYLGGSLTNVFVDLCLEEGVDLMKKCLAICFDFAEVHFKEKVEPVVFGDGFKGFDKE